ncbi:DUF4124 domain-containing protein [Silvimonas sp.]|uniref:DUF4124 domain-containing protein n=1 Tax=Silvimonas sp. TaxID=2650811 RepID=UPI00283EF7E1|nr:DUF4124 domain-containing protein [Silvimonas sp.]MDR3428660.1 DUF4124 domain-containing protein [Silvimonas sp.]
MRYLLALAVLCGCAALAQAQIYKWKDANGNTQYSDTPPTAAQGKAQVVNIKTATVNTIPAPASRPAAVATPPAAGASAPAAEQAASQKDEKACNTAKTRLGFLQSATKLQSINEKGEVEMLDANKKKAEIDKAAASIQKYCE